MKTLAALSFLLLGISVAHAAATDSSDDFSTPPSSPTPTAPLAPVQPEETPPAPRPAAKPRIPHSRLTNDTSEYEADKRRLLLTTGEDRAIDLDFEVNSGANGISVGNPKVVATTLVKIGDKRQIVFKPLSAGESTVTVRDQDGTLRLIFKVKVTGSDILEIASEIRNLLRDVEGIDVRIVGQKVVIEGEVLVPADYGRMLGVLQDGDYTKFVINLTTLSPLALSVIARKIQEDINVFAPNVKTRVVNGRIFLEGTVDSIDQARSAERVATLYIPDPRPGDPLVEREQTAQRLTPPKSIVQNFIIVNPPAPKKAEKLVRVTVHFVELSKDYSSLFGFKWQPGFTSDPSITIGNAPNGTTGAASGTSFTATINSLIPKLLSAQNAGYARVLRTGTVIVRSGQPAKLEDTTEVPYTTAGANGQIAATSAKVGLHLGITPQVLGQSEDISMDIKLEQSSFISKPTVGQAPITADHRVETKVYVKSNESAAIAAVNSSDVQTSFNKDDPNPGSFQTGTSTGGGTTDALFTLFRSKNYSKQKTQFVIFITPQILDNASEGTEDLKKNFRIKVK